VWKGEEKKVMEEEVSKGVDTLVSPPKKGGDKPETQKPIGPMERTGPQPIKCFFTLKAAKFFIFTVRP